MASRSVDIQRRLTLNSRAMLVMFGIFLAVLTGLVIYIFLGVRTNLHEANDRGKENAVVLQFLKDIQDPHSQLFKKNHNSTEALVQQLVDEIRINRQVEQENTLLLHQLIDRKAP